MAKAAKPRHSTVNPRSAHALAMLTRWPVHVTPVPRFRVEARAPGGAVLVYDRAASEWFVVYVPRLVTQFRAGHGAGLWYLRPATDVGTAPRSRGYSTACAAVEAIRAGRWSLSIPSGAQPRAPFRVIWS
jgi:hypothetical protein